MKVNVYSTKFLQSLFVQFTGAVALFMKIIDGGTYVALSTLALGIYSYSDVQQKKYEKQFSDQNE